MKPVRGVSSGNSYLPRREPRTTALLDSSKISYTVGSRLENTAMSITQTPGISASEAAIFSRVFADGRRSLTPELARHILTLEFSDDDKARMHELAEKNQEGRISPEELRDLDSYIKVADVLAILQSKARKFLRTKSK
jgi:hypothetical protein